MSFEVIKWVYNKTFVKIMKNTRGILKIFKVMSRSVRMSGFSSGQPYFRLYHAWFSGNHLIEKGNITHEHAEKGTSVIFHEISLTHSSPTKPTDNGFSTVIS